ncbi:MAG TPA: DUF2288 domain-containing protein [Geobacteraceae bacterium]
MIPTREELSLAVDEAAWGWLRAHLERGGLIVVACGLDIVEVGVKLASDDAAAIGGWIAGGGLTKPSAEQIAAWDGDREKRFLCLIVSPYVLIQEKPVVPQQAKECRNMQK